MSSVRKLSDPKKAIQRVDTGEGPACAFRQTLGLLEGKWKFPVIHSLLKRDKMRFKELERDLAGITPRMLIKELKDLAQAGIVTRTAYATVPPTVEYALTECGRTLQPVMDAIQAWGEAHEAIIARAQRA
ncbi:MAG TPA: helix-turn-helix domain-containing protein [Flavobacteriales bacterium]|jgi:DNA-binding HxlR family transcriptional regulator|nr:helix-turn-helix domain-containing protein [Flavobacteriales bacterium]